ncbi:MAG: hypothetical protein ABIG34_04435 [Candidatus Peregrinibacteria bacterium]
MGKTFDSIVGFFITATVLIVLFFSVNKLGEFINSSPTKPLPTDIVTPAQELPTDTGSKLQFHTVSIIDKPYKVPNNPFENDVYKKFPRVVIGRYFEQAVLRIQGKVTSRGDEVFLILNFNKQGGIIRAVRSSANKLDIAATDNRGGIFRAGDNIDISVNLMKDNLGTIASEFIRTNVGEREFNLLSRFEDDEAPTLAVIPFMNNGQYGGAEISSLSIEYACQLGKECAIARCEPSYKYSTVCVEEVFGSGAVQPLLDRHPEWKK